MVFSTKSASGLKYCPETNIAEQITGKNIHISAEISSPSVVARTEVNGEGSYILYVRGILKAEEGTHIINQSLLVDGGVVSEMSGHQQSSDILIITPDANEVEIKLLEPASISLEIILRPLSNIDYTFDGIFEPSIVTQIS